MPKPTNGQPNWGGVLNDYLDGVEATANAALPATQKGTASGVAPLGADSRVPEANLPAHVADAALTAKYVASPQVRTMTVSTTQPATPTEGELWIPSTDYLTTHTHPENQPNLTLQTTTNSYHHLWGSGVVGTDNLGAFSGALFNRLHLAPFYWPEDTAFQSFHSEVTTLGTGVVRFGIYPHDATTGRPGNLTADLGTVDVTTTGTKAITVSYNLLRGWHWLAWVWQGTNTTGPVIRARTMESGLITAGSASFSPTTRHAVLYASGINAPGALPTSITGTILSNSSPLVPSVALRRVA